MNAEFISGKPSDRYDFVAFYGNKVTYYQNALDTMEYDKAIKLLQTSFVPTGTVLSEPLFISSDSPVAQSKLIIPPDLVGIKTIEFLKGDVEHPIAIISFGNNVRTGEDNTELKEWFGLTQGYYRTIVLSETLDDESSCEIIVHKSDGQQIATNIYDFRSIPGFASHYSQLDFGSRRYVTGDIGVRSWNLKNSDASEDKLEFTAPMIGGIKLFSDFSKEFLGVREFRNEKEVDNIPHVVVGDYDKGAVLKGAEYVALNGEKITNNAVSPSTGNTSQKIKYFRKDLDRTVSGYMSVYTPYKTTSVTLTKTNGYYKTENNNTVVHIQNPGWISTPYGQNIVFSPEEYRNKTNLSFVLNNIRLPYDPETNMIYVSPVALKTLNNEGVVVVSERNIKDTRFILHRDNTSITKYSLSIPTAVEPKTVEVGQCLGYEYMKGNEKHYLSSNIVFDKKTTVSVEHFFPFGDDEQRRIVGLRFSHPYIKACICSEAIAGDKTHECTDVGILLYSTSESWTDGKLPEMNPYSLIVHSAVKGCRVFEISITKDSASTAFVEEASGLLEASWTR